MQEEKQQAEREVMKGIKKKKKKEEKEIKLEENELQQKKVKHRETMRRWKRIT